MSKVYDSLMKSGNFTAHQNKTENGEFVNSIGELVEICEKEGFKYEVMNSGSFVVSIEGENDYTIGLGAHVDTLGAMVCAINGDGTLKFDRIGGPILPTYDGEYCQVLTRDGKSYSGTFLCKAQATHVHKGANTMERNTETMIVRLDEVVHCKEDVEKLIHYFPTDTQKQIMERFPTRSYKAICDKADELGLIRENKKSKWAIEEDEIIIKYSSEIDILELAKKLPNRTPVAIEARIRKLVGGKKEIKAKVGEKLEKEVSQIQQEVKEKEIVVCENNTLVEEVIIENKVEETPAVITGQTVEGIPTEELPLIEDFSPEEIEVFEEKKENITNNILNW